MKYIIGTAVIILALYLFFRYKPSGKHIKKMFAAEICFGAFTMMSTMNFSDGVNSVLTIFILWGLCVMSVCLYGAILCEQRCVAKTAKVKKTKRIRTQIACSPRKINSVA